MVDIAYILEWIAAIAALVFFYKYKHRPIQLIIVLLWLTVLAETAARIPSLFIDGTNHLIYNCYLITSYPLLYYIIYRHIQHPLRKNIVMIIAFLVTSIVLLRAFTTPFMTQFMVYMFSVCTIALVIILLLYAVDVLKSNRRIVLKNSLELFVFVGYLFFGIAYIPLSFVLTSDDFIRLSRGAISIFSAIQNATAILMYALFIFGFIWTDSRRNLPN